MKMRSRILGFVGSEAKINNARKFGRDLSKWRKINEGKKGALLREARDRFPDSLQPSRRLTRTIFREGIALSSSADARINTWRARAAAPLKRAPLKRHEREREGEREASVRVAVPIKHPCILLRRDCSLQSNKVFQTMVVQCGASIVSTNRKDVQPNRERL